MGQFSKIQWTDHTFNPWIGCTKVSPGCANCYAESLDERRFSKQLDGGTKAAPVCHWGKGAPRHRTKASNWKKVCTWNDQAEHFHSCTECGWRGVPDSQPSGVFGQLLGCPVCDANESYLKPARQMVFCASMADWLDDEVPIEWLVDLLDLIRLTPNLDWQLLTKRPQNWRRRVGAACDALSNLGPRAELKAWLWKWLGEPFLSSSTPPSNVWIGTTMEDQERANERAYYLHIIPSRVRFVSMEPLLGLIDMLRTAGDPPSSGFALTDGWGRVDGEGEPLIHWVIVGGESGDKDAPIRPMNPDWVRSIRNQCQAAGVAFFFKQWGDWVRDADIVSKHPIEGMGPAFSRAVPYGDGDPTNFRRMYRIGKKHTGRRLDGVEHNAFPA